MNRFVMVLLLGMLLVGIPAQTQNAPTQLAAVMQVTSAGVEIQRVNTAQRIPISVESVIGVGDLVITDANGAATITFREGITTDLLPNTTYRIEGFQGEGETFELTAEVLSGQTNQRINTPLNPQSRYQVRTPGMRMGARGTAFAVRVEDDGRSAMIVTEGTVAADAESNAADVGAGFGVRADAETGLSDVVPATTFDQLDAALDGCGIAITTPDDVSLNVRIGPNVDQTRVGVILAEEIDTAYGTNAGGDWYRIRFGGHFGWVLASNAQIIGQCAGLRPFADDYAEDASAYGDLSNPLLNVPDLPASVAADGAADTQAD